MIYLQIGCIRGGVSLFLAVVEASLPQWCQRLWLLFPALGCFQHRRRAWMVFFWPGQLITISYFLLISAGGQVILTWFLVWVLSKFLLKECICSLVPAWSGARGSMELELSGGMGPL